MGMTPADFSKLFRAADRAGGLTEELWASPRFGAPGTYKNVQRRYRAHEKAMAEKEAAQAVEEAALLRRMPRAAQGGQAAARTGDKYPTSNPPHPLSSNRALGCHRSCRDLSASYPLPFSDVADLIFGLPGLNYMSGL